ncbi:MAG: hypothetical protein WC718_14860 [Phycisphaerales bacterium]|jgi:hypothetical protein
MAKSAIPVDLYALRPSDGKLDQALTVDSTSGGVQLTAYGEIVTHVFWTCEAAQCRFTLDGSAPTTTNGHPLEAGDVGVWPASWLRTAKFIRTGSTSAILQVSPLTMSGV